MPHITINPELCNKDGICVQTCPETVFAWPDSSAPPQVTHPQHCIACGHCVAICPTEAIDHSDFPPGSLHVVEKSGLPSSRQLEELLRSRRSIRTYRDQPVDRALVDQIIEAARYAPSAHNRQCTEYVVVQDRDLLAQISRAVADYLAGTSKLLRHPVIGKALPHLAPGKVKDAHHMVDSFDKVTEATFNGDDKVLHNPPLMLIFHASTRIVMADINASLALQNASLMVEGLGLGCFYAGYMVSAAQARRDIRDLLGIPDKHQVHAALAIGYPKFKFKRWVERRPARVTWK